MSLHSNIPAGFRAEHFKSMLQRDASTRLRRQLVCFVNFVASGRALPSIAPLLGGARLTPLRKKFEGVRPVASGDILRRLTSRCFCRRHAFRLRELLEPHQFGVAFPGGAERVVHETRRWVSSAARDGSEIAVKVDFSNAFNCVTRDAFLAAVRRDIPDMAAYVEWVYKAVPILWYGDNELASEEGVQQGDPLGPALFSLAIAPLTKRLRADYPRLALNHWFLDDGTLAGPTEVVREAFHELSGPPRKRVPLTRIVLNRSGHCCTDMRANVRKGSA
jgi:hypothetical protein